MKQHSDIIKEVSAQTGIDIKRVDLTIKHLIKGIKRLIGQNKKIKINGFATFSLKKTIKKIYNK